VPTITGVSSAERRAPWAWLALTTLTLVVLAAVLVPWDWLPGGSSASVDPTAGLPADTLAAIDDYRDTVVPLGLAGTAVSLAVALGLALTPIGARLVRRLPGQRWWPLHLAVTVLTLIVIGRLAVLPLAVPAELAQRDAGLSTQNWPSWTLDVARGVLVEAVATTLALLVIVGLARWGRQGWWWLASVLAGAFVVAGSFLYPLLVEPVFNDFEPMRAGPLRTSLVELAAEDGMAVDEVLVADASRRTTALNAYVSGLGSSRRIVVYDTLLDGAPDDQVRLVVAHELGHAEADDVLVGTSLGALGAVAGITLLVLVAGSGPVRRRSSVRTLGAVEVVPLALGLAAVATLLSLPAQNLVSRAVEARADVHALGLTGDVRTFAAMQRRLATANLSDPDPPRWLYGWFATHPTVTERIALARGWERGPSAQSQVVEEPLAARESQGALMVPCVVCPSTSTPATTIAAMNAAMSPYSTADAPVS